MDEAKETEFGSSAPADGDSGQQRSGRLAVLLLSDSFHAVWEEIASEAGAELRVGREVADLTPLAPTDAVMIAAGGAEFELADPIASLHDAGASRVVAVGADASHRAAVSAMTAGAAEYLALPEDLSALRSWVAECVRAEEARGRAEARAVAEQRSYDFSAIVGESDLLREALRRAARVIPRDRATVLLTGETGTGKELVAQAIHYNGPRAARPFVEVNCSALPANLLEAELFGYERGAFTDARTAKPGLFEAAHGGTLFLDEIGELRVDLQAKLLRALEERSVRRLGSLQSRAVDVRIIAATHVHLPAAVESGEFRRDLYFRLNVVGIELPPLRSRGRDVVLLANHFLRAIARDYGLEPPTLPQHVEESLLRRRWPGNVRELRNAMERAVVLGGAVVEEADFAPALHSDASDGPLPFPAPLGEIAQAAAEAMLVRHGGNKSAAARALGVSRSRLYRLLEGSVE